MLRRHRRRLVALAVAHGFTYYREILHGIGRFAREHLDWELTSLAPEMRRSPSAMTASVDGVIASISSTWLANFFMRWTNPVVNIDAIVPGLTFPRVGVDNAAIGELAVKHFLDRGLANFAFVGHRDWQYSRERETAFCSILQRAGFSASVYHSRKSHEFDPLGRVWHLDRGAERWLKHLPKPVGLLTPNDLWGLQVVEICLRAGIQIPEEIAILGVDNDVLNCDLSRPALSSVIVPSEQIGVRAAMLLDHLMRGGKRPRDPILLKPTGVEVRQSTDVLAIDDSDVVTAIRFVRENSCRGIRVSDVLRVVPLSRSVLERRVKSSMGHTLGEEIRRTRLSHATKLLISTDMPMSLVATRAGYSDYRQLAAAFRTNLETTPTAYRRSHRLAEEHL